MQSYGQWDLDYGLFIGCNLHKTETFQEVASLPNSEELTEGRR